MQCIVEVLRCERKFADDQSTFLVELPFTPAPGDYLILTPGPSWGKIECLVIKRVISSEGVRVVARVDASASTRKTNAR